MTEIKRPRIDPHLAEPIDAMRGRMTFEAAIADALEMYLQVYVVEEHKRKPRIATDAELMKNLLRTDRFQFNGPQFRRAFDEAMEDWQREMDEQAREDEEMYDEDNPHGITLVCPECDSGHVRIPGSPKALPGQALDPRHVAAECGECEHSAPLVDFTRFRGVPEIDD